MTSTRPLRIVVLSQFYAPEPVPLHCQLAAALASEGHSVRVITGFPNYPGGALYPGYRQRLRSVECIDGVEVFRFPLFVSHDDSAIRRTLNYVSFALSALALGSRIVRNADVVYVYHPPGTVGAVAGLWRRMFRVPFVLHVQDLWPESVIESGFVKSSLARRVIDRVLAAVCTFAYNEASALAVISPGFRERLVARGVTDDKISVVPNWADEALHFPSPRDELLAAEFGLDHGVAVMFAGNVGYYQALDSAVRAAARVRHLADFRLFIVGTGQAVQSLRDVAAELSATNVVFVGRQPSDVAARLTRLAAAQLVSLRDLPFFAATIPSKTQASMAAGLPMIMMVRGDAAAIVEAADAGIVVEPENVDALAAAFEQIYRMTSEERALLGANGRRYYERHFSFRAAKQQFIELLSSASSARGSKDGKP